MTDVRLSQRPDGDLEAALRGLAPAIEWPTARHDPDGPDLAATVRARIEANPASDRPVTEPRRGSRWTWRPARRALVLALVALLALAALAGAIGLGLPGLRIFLGQPPASSPGSQPVNQPPSLDPSRSPAAGAPGAALGLGERVELADVDARAGFDVTWPSDPAVGPPDAAYVNDQKGGLVSLVWASTPDLPATLEPGVGLLLSQFRGDVDEGFFGKALGGETTIALVKVGDERGFWLEGDPHMFFWEGPSGPVHEERRWVGDALVWSNGVITYRLETSLGRDEAIRLALTLD